MDITDPIQALYFDEAVARIATERKEEWAEYEQDFAEKKRKLDGKKESR